MKTNPIKKTKVSSTKKEKTPRKPRATAKQKEEIAAAEETQKTIQKFYNSEGQLMFAYSPQIPLDLSVAKLKEFFFNESKSNSTLALSIKEICDNYSLAPQEVIASIKFFYICYCIKVNGHNCLFYNLYAKFLRDLIPCEPLVFLNVSDEDVLLFIDEIENSFSPSPHQKSLIENYVDEKSGLVGELIEFLYKWANVKLETFAEDYSQNKDVLNFISSLIDKNKKIEKKKDSLFSDILTSDLPEVKVSRSQAEAGKKLLSSRGAK